MSCTRPLKAYWANAARDRITFDRVRSVTKISFDLPCNWCPGCRMKRAEQWGIRCMHEAKMWPHNCFVTLTYSDEFLPPGGTLVLDHVQTFMDTLRVSKKRLGEGKIRFFCGAEYGEENGRPHYHLLLFNCRFSDMLLHTYNKRGEGLYTSAELSRYWTKGFSTIGAVSFASAIYCAKYSLKAARGSEPYEVYDEDGVCHVRAREFAVMSRRPGIGRAYYDKYGGEIRALDSIVVDGREVQPPRYYAVRGSELDPEGSERHRKRRKRLAVLNAADNTPERLRVKEKLMVIAAERKERKL